MVNDREDATQTGDKPMDRPHVQRWIAIAERANLETDDETEDSAFIGVRDGFEEAVQLIDTLTGGDGEYRFSTDPARNCPTPVEMIDCILARFEQETREQPLDTIQRLGQEFDAPEASPSLGMGEAHGDRKCDACHRDNPVWFAPSPLWNLVIGGPEATDDPGGVLCPICFIEKAEAAGIMPATGAWLVTKEPAASLSPPSPDLAEENERLREALEAIQLSGIHRDAKWAGMNAHDIARATLQSISTGNP